MATSDSECERLKKLVIPKNDKNICWWLSVNLALFHKKRPEFDAIANPTIQQQVLLDVYKHYSGEKEQRLDFLSTGARDQLAATAAPGATAPNASTSASASASASASTAPNATAATTAPNATAATTAPNATAATTAPNATAPPTAATTATAPTAPNATAAIAPSPTAPTATPTDGESPFQIDGTGYQSVSEYFTYIVNIFTTKEDTLNTVFIPIINGSPNDFQAEYDVYYHAQYFGIPRITDSKNPISPESSLAGVYEFPNIPIPSSRQTLVLSFERLTKGKEYDSYEIVPQETITIPTCKTPIEQEVYKVPIVESKEKTLKTFVKDTLLPNTETSTFALDAITVSSPGGGHFVTYVKCGDAWIYDNGFSEGSLATKDGHRVFTSFDDMMKDGEAIRKNLVFLYYSKVPVP